MNSQSPNDEILPSRTSGRASARGTPTSASPPTPPKPEPLVWGVVGTLHRLGETVDPDALSGVLRYVTAGVKYVMPPIQNVWLEVPSEPERYDFPWAGDPQQARNLERLRRDLASDKALSSLAELDAVVDGLFELAHGLHLDEWRLGLIQPTNVVWASAEMPRPSLLDLGFFWSGSTGNYPWKDSPGRPSWLEPSLERNPAAWLWDHEPIRRQFAFPDVDVCEPVPVSADIKTLARLFAWLMTGRAERQLSKPATTGERRLWETLIAANNGEIASVDVFSSQLSQTPLSLHWQQAPTATFLPTSDDKQSSPWALIGGVTTGVAVLGTAIFLFTRGPAVEPVGNGEQPIEAVVKADEIEAMTKQATQVAAQPANTPAEIATRSKLVDDWVITFTKLDEEVHDNLTRRYETAGQMIQLVEQLTKIHNAPTSDKALQEKEQQCLDLARSRIAELVPSP